MIHKTGRNLIFNSAPCQHFIPSSSVARESALAFPIYLQWEKRQGGEGKAASAHVSSLLTTQTELAGCFLPPPIPPPPREHQGKPAVVPAAPTITGKARSLSLSSVCTQLARPDIRGGCNRFFRPPMVLSAFPGRRLTCMALLINISTPSFFF